MSTGYDWTHWHLTPRGWEPGAWYIAGAGAFQVPIPVDRVASYEFSRRLGPGGNANSGVSALWLSENSAAIVALLVRFGPPPRALHMTLEREREETRDIPRSPQTPERLG